MMSGSDRRFVKVRAVALASCALAALQTATANAQTTPSGGPIKPLYGNISPFYGNISPFYGNISPFYGNISPFYGNISPFWGNISPFYGNISPFWGNISPFTATTDATLTGFYGTAYDPFWGAGPANPYTKPTPPGGVKYANIAGFWNTEAASWQTVQTAWAAAQTSADFAAVATQLQNAILTPASSFWGAAVMQATKTKSFAAGFSNTALANAGITLNGDGTINASSLASLSPTQQAMFFLNLYDGLMTYSGTGRVDWWMGATHWSPALAATDGVIGKGSSPVTVGMLDFTVTNNQKDAKGSLLQYGSNVFSNGHGAAVGSLIMGSIDGSGIMGVLPTGASQVVVYDPYDSSNTTNWTDVGTGIQVLANATFSKKGAPVGVLNASLGVPGWTLNPGWNDALASGAAAGHNLVIAAGNDGVTQTTNVAWNFALNPTLIVVGSVGVDGTISNFSNRPGEACLLDTAAASAACVEANKLKYRFIVAPGELVLVSDGNGGVTRQSGTSLAAPLVSGAIGLLQARWPWLANYSNETAQIILKSATPLGANPGADPVYGVGELNIAASQAPLNFGALQYYPVTNGKASVTPVSIASVISQVSSGTQATFNASKLSINALEPIGNTYRDFEIPLASTLVGQTVQTAAGTQAFQSYLTIPLRNWIGSSAAATASTVATTSGAGSSVGNSGGAGKAGDGGEDDGFVGFMQSSQSIGRLGGMDLRMRAAPAAPTLGFKQEDGAVDAELALVGRRTSLRFGFGGGGASALDGQEAFAQSSDHTGRGGADPLLGLASGGAFFNGRFGLTNRVMIDAGVTQRRSQRDLALFGVGDQGSPAAIYEASAEHLGVDVAVNGALTLHGAFTRLRENSGLLGVQSLSGAALGRGSTTTGASLGIDVRLGGGVTLAASGTMADTTTPTGQALATGPGGLRSSAGEVALTKSDLFAPLDRLRLTFSKSMQVDGGQLHYAAYGVVDRQTGALGLIDQTTGAADGRTPLSAELMYGRLLPGRAAEVSMFLRAETNTYNTTVNGLYDYVAGAKYLVHF